MTAFESSFEYQYFLKLGAKPVPPSESKPKPKKAKKAKIKPKAKPKPKPKPKARPKAKGKAKTHDIIFEKIDKLIIAGYEEELAKAEAEGNHKRAREAAKKIAKAKVEATKIAQRKILAFDKVRGQKPPKRKIKPFAYRLAVELSEQAETTKNKSFAQWAKDRNEFKRLSDCIEMDELEITRLDWLQAKVQLEASRETLEQYKTKSDLNGAHHDALEQVKEAEEEVKRIEYKGRFLRGVLKTMLAELEEGNIDPLPYYSESQEERQARMFWVESVNLDMQLEMTENNIEWYAVGNDAPYGWTEDYQDQE